MRDSSTALGMTNKAAFTIIELLIVIAIIIILAGLILATSGYVQKKGARSRAETEIAAMSAALESYKADNGVYAKTSNTDALQTTGSIDNNATNGSYAKASLDLYALLSGDTAYDGSSATTKVYMSFKPQMLGRSNRSLPPSSSNKITSIVDPFGNSYGYSTVEASTGNNGFNPTFDLWSTAGLTSGSGSNTSQWVKNW